MGDDEKVAGRGCGRRTAGSRSNLPAAMKIIFFSDFCLTNAKDYAIILLLSGCGAVGSALPWGGRGRPFKSGHSDQPVFSGMPKAPVQHAQELLFSDCDIMI